MVDWNNLSIADKADIIKVALNHGYNTLPKIKELYNKFAKGGPLKSYTDFANRLSKAWGNQDISKDNYDYQKYYNDNPEEAYRQLESIEHGGKGHFPDEGRSGTYKTPNHSTYPDLGINSWLNNGRIFNISARQANQGLDNLKEEINTDRILDYLGSDLYYNKGATKVMYNGAYQLPSITVTPNGSYMNLVPNELGTGWMYKDRVGRFKDFNYNKYNKLAKGGNLFETGGADDARYKHAITLYKGYVDAGVKPQAALELVNQQIAEKGWNTWASGDNKKFNNANDFIKHTIDYHTRMYPDTLDANNFMQFFKGLEFGKYRYNPNTQKYKKDLLLTRPGVKKRINKYRATLGQTPLAFMNNPYSSYSSEEASIPLNVPLLTTPLLLGQENITALGGNLYRKGGYIPSKKLRNDIAMWEGSSMKTNRSFEAEAKDFNTVIPKEIRDKLSSNQLDALYSYGYNVGMNNLKERVLPVLKYYTQGKATNEEVQQAMWASKDSKLRGLTNRRNWERAMFGGNYRSKYTGMPSSYTISQNFFDNINNQINTLPLPSMRDPNSTLDRDPSTIYKPIIIDDTPVVESSVEPPIELPQEAPNQGLENLSKALNMISPNSSITNLLNGTNDTIGLLKLVR